MLENAYYNFCRDSIENIGIYIVCVSNDLQHISVVIKGMDCRVIRVCTFVIGVCYFRGYACFRLNVNYYISFCWETFPELLTGTC